MNLELKDKIVVILASSKGLGKATAKEFAFEGAKVIITGRNKKDLVRTKEEIISETNNTHVIDFVCDITKPQDIKKLRENTIATYKKVDILINNSGGPPAGLFEEMTDEMWQHSFELNLLSYIRATREFIPYMKEQQKGHIVNFVSSSIKQSIDNLILSNTFRSGLVGFNKSMSQELSKYNILINNVGPGRVLTDRTKQLDEIKASKLNVSYESVKSDYESIIPMGRYGEPIEFAKFVVFLCSSANTYLTGQSILIDGGLVKSL